MRRPAKVYRPQVYTADYITTSFGVFTVRQIRDWVLGSAFAVAVFLLSLKFFGWCFGWA